MKRLANYRTALSFIACNLPCKGVVEKNRETIQTDTLPAHGSHGTKARPESGSWETMPIDGDVGNAVLQTIRVGAPGEHFPVAGASGRCVLFSFCSGWRPLPLTDGSRIGSTLWRGSREPDMALSAVATTKVENSDII